MGRGGKRAGGGKKLGNPQRFDGVGGYFVAVPLVAVLHFEGLVTVPWLPNLHVGLTEEDPQSEPPCSDSGDSGAPPVRFSQRCRVSCMHIHIQVEDLGK